MRQGATEGVWLNLVRQLGQEQRRERQRCPYEIPDSYTYACSLAHGASGVEIGTFAVVSKFQLHISN